MAEKNDFQHLGLPQIHVGRAKLFGGGEKSEETKAHEEDRPAHAGYIGNQLTAITGQYKQRSAARDAAKKPPLPAGIPFILRLDTDEDPEFLKTAFDLEIVSETADGYVLVSTSDIDLVEFRRKLDLFVAKKYGGANAAKVHELITPESIQDRLVRILSDGLFQNYAKLQSEPMVTVDLGVECQGLIKLPEFPVQQKKQSDESYRRSILRWKENYENAQKEIEELQIRREQELIKFIQDYKGTVVSITQDQIATHSLHDSFTMRVQVSGACLKDLAENYPYLFDIQEIEIDLQPDGGEIADGKGDIKITPPDKDAPIIVIADSGIQEEHLLVRDAIIPGSKSLMAGTSSTDAADYVKPSGHGTRVAGAALFPNGANLDGSEHKHLLRIRNIRVLDNENNLPEHVFPPYMVLVAAQEANDIGAKVINFSINGRLPCKLNYMSAWGAAIDQACWDSDLVVVQSAGNLGPVSYSSRRGYLTALGEGANHPDYLLTNGCRVSNPAQSMQALTVGSILHAQYEDQDFKALSDIHMPASYTTTGPGLWGAIKPDVVEFGGDYVFSKSKPVTGRIDQSMTLRLPRSTLHGGPLSDADQVGTSFAAPRVSALAAELHGIVSEGSSNLIKALIVNAATWPEWVKNFHKKRDVYRLIGHGIPNREVAIHNDDYRITLITPDVMFIKSKGVHVYQIPIPGELRSPTNDNSIEVSVCLSYTGRPRRTRKNLQRYYSTWADWKASKVGEPVSEFLTRVSADANAEEIEKRDPFPWVVGAKTSDGIEGIKRSANSIQKDWFEIPAHALPENFCIAVQGHQGWDTNPEAVARYALVVGMRSTDQSIPIYSTIQTSVEQLIHGEVIISVETA